MIIILLWAFECPTMYRLRHIAYKMFRGAPRLTIQNPTGWDSHGRSRQQSDYLTPQIQKPATNTTKTISMYLLVKSVGGTTHIANIESSLVHTSYSFLIIASKSCALTSIIQSRHEWPLALFLLLGYRLQTIFLLEFFEEFDVLFLRFFDGEFTDFLPSFVLMRALQWRKRKNQYRCQESDLRGEGSRVHVIPGNQEIQNSPSCSGRKSRRLPA